MLSAAKEVVEETNSPRLKIAASVMESSKLLQSASIKDVTAIGLEISIPESSTPEIISAVTAILLLCVCAAIKVIALVESRDGKNNRMASDLFDKNELTLLFLICRKLEGKTKKQQNLHTPNSMTWASWIIARLGGWNGYASESPPGPIMMLRGLQKFELQYEGWLLAQ